MKSMSVQTRRPVLTRATIGRVVGGWPIWLHRAGLKRLAGRGYVADLLPATRRDHPREARIQAPFFGWPWPGSTQDVGSLSASLGGVSFAPAPRSGARDARSR